MPVHKIESIPGRIRLWTDSRSPHADVDTAAIEQRLGRDKREAAAKIKKQLQNSLNARQPIADLPRDDPDRTTNPGRPEIFWEDSYLVARSIIVEDVMWSRDRYTFTLSRARKQWR